MTRSDFPLLVEFRQVSSGKVRSVFPIAIKARAPSTFAMERALGDAIVIEELELNLRIGVPEAERAAPQRLVVCLSLWPSENFDHLGDDLARTVDYAAVAPEVRVFCEQRTDKLIETLAAAIATHLLATFALRAVKVELRKFVLPQCKHVAAIVTRIAG